VKVVVNRQYGGFELSNEAFDELIKLGWKVTEYSTEGNLVDPSAEIVRNDKHITFNKYSFGRYYGNEIELRTNPLLIDVVERLGERAYGRLATLEIVEIPDDEEFTIEDYDGREWVAGAHRTW